MGSFQLLRLISKQQRRGICRNHGYTLLSSIFPAPTTACKQLDLSGRHEKQSADLQKSISAQILRNAHYIFTVSTGIFSLSPQLFRSYSKFCSIIDQEMELVNAFRVSLPVIGTEEMWKRSNRWAEMDSELFTFQDRNDKSLCLSPTHEEAITSLVGSLSPLSYKQLPLRLYQIGRKFRDEGRPKNGLLRCREFEMQDLYTFDRDEPSAMVTYEQVTHAYEQILKRIEVPFKRVSADCGKIGGFLSHEFQIMASAGEDELSTCDICNNTFNKEFLQDLSESGYSKLCAHQDCNKKKFATQAGIEIAHTFLLGTKYSRTFNACHMNKDGQKSDLVMGCYGIGVTRLLAAALEAAECKDSFKWPKILAPYQVLIIPQKEGYKSDVTLQLSQQLATILCELPDFKNEVVIDDRLQLSIGQRVAQAKQYSYPYIVAVGKKALGNEPIFEIIDNCTGAVQFYSLSNTVAFLKDNCITIPLHHK